MSPKEAAFAIKAVVMDLGKGKMLKRLPIEDVSWMAFIKADNRMASSFPR
jgi:hypothetical protein